MAKLEEINCERSCYLLLRRSQELSKILEQVSDIQYVASLAVPRSIPRISLVEVVDICMPFPPTRVCQRWRQYEDIVKVVENRRESLIVRSFGSQPVSCQYLCR